MDLDVIRKIESWKKLYSEKYFSNKTLKSQHVEKLLLKGLLSANNVYFDNYSWRFLIRSSRAIRFLSYTRFFYKYYAYKHIQAQILQKT